MSNRLLLILLSLPITCCLANASTYQVGSSRTYTDPNALFLAGVVQDGDTILIDAEVYTGPATLAVWSQDHLFIRGANGNAQLVADGSSIQGKGIWVISGDSAVIENVGFSGAQVPDMNGAGIRLEGIGLTVRSCYFHQNENGILTNNPDTGHVLVEYCEFSNNGFGDGFSHNIYIGRVDKLTFQYNYSHHALVGHNLKSRADTNYIYHNRIMDQDTGRSSRLIDISNGGRTIIVGNLLMQGPLAENQNLVGFGLEGLSNTGPHEFYFTHNSCVNKRVASCLFLDIATGTAIAHIANNIFAGAGTLINGTATTNTHNLVRLDISKVEFVDEASYDYHLLPTSPAIDTGLLQTDLPDALLHPTHSYAHIASEELRTIVDDTVDAGAYEFGVVFPIVLSSFTANILAGRTTLKWTTLSEIHNEGFEIQKSTNGEAFHKIGWVSGHVNSSTINHYTFEDFQPQSGYNYYKLKQIDSDGGHWYSSIATVYLRKVTALHPNPSSDFIFLGPEARGKKYIVQDLSGQHIKEGILDRSELSISSLIPGTYIITIVGLPEMLPTKFIKN